MARARPRVLAVGDVIVDVVTPPLPPLRARDEQLQVRAHALLPGGNAANFALASAALGSSTTFVGCVGKDPLAGIVRRAFTRLRVDARLRVDFTRPTGATVALTWSLGGRSLITAPGANTALRERDVSSSVLRGVDHLHRAGFWWTPGLLGRPTARLLAAARRLGSTTSLDVSTDPEGWTASRIHAVRVCLPHVDTFFGNAAEVRAIARKTNLLAAARALCRIGAGEIVVHKGGNGATWVSRGDVLSVPAIPVPVDNPTGCGDVFNAGYVRARLSGQTPREALELANACGALHLKDRRYPYPRLSQVRAFLRRQRSAR